LQAQCIHVLADLLHLGSMPLLCFLRFCMSAQCELFQVSNVLLDLRRHTQKSSLRTRLQREAAAAAAAAAVAARIVPHTARVEQKSIAPALQYNFGHAVCHAFSPSTRSANSSIAKRALEDLLWRSPTSCPTVLHSCARHSQRRPVHAVALRVSSHDAADQEADEAAGGIH
jgi:hypothetical protein